MASHPVPTQHAANHSTYLTLLKAHNVLLHETVKATLGNAALPSCQDIAICITGSDGRLEKGPYSDLEFLVLYNGTPEAKQRLEPILEMLQSFNGYKIAEKIDVRDVLLDSMNTFGSSEKQVYPGRILDSNVVHGNEHLLYLGKVKLIHEWLAPDGSKFHSRVKKKLKEARAICESGKQKFNATMPELVHFNVKDGLLHYDPRNNLYSLKQGPLRAIQYDFVRRVIRACRKIAEQDEAVAFVKGLPRTICPRIDYLREHDSYEHDEKTTERAIDAYREALYYYHLSQEACLQGETTIQIPRAELQTVLSDILAVLPQTETAK